MNVVPNKNESLVMAIVLMLLMVSCAKEQEPTTDSKTDTASSVRTFQTSQVKPGPITRTIWFSGLVVPIQKLNVVAEQQGIARATPRSFKTGVRFRKGETLVRMDRRESENNLSAQRSQLLAAMVRAMSDLKLDYPSEFPVWNEYLANIREDATLPKLPKIQTRQLRYFLATNNILNLYYSIKSGEDRLEKYTIRAPFDGTVSHSQLDVGNLIQPGAKLGEFIRTDAYEIESSVSLSEIGQLSIGQTLTFTSPDLAGEWQAVITRIGNRIDQASQAVTVYSKVSGPGLKEGMYLEGVLAAGEFQQAVKIPQNIITRDNQVYVIEDTTVKLKAVELLDLKNEMALVAGLSSGDVLITEPVTTQIQGIHAMPK